jgi:hypothetical protein
LPENLWFWEKAIAGEIEKEKRVNLYYLFKRFPYLNRQQLRRLLARLEAHGKIRLASARRAEEEKTGPKREIWVWVK